jgi:signal transduction histidine kinase
LRSLGLKLTLAFVVVGLVGTTIVALFVGFRTRQHFDRFVLDRIQANTVDYAADYYAANGSWDGIGAALLREPSLRMALWNQGRAPLVLADSRGTVVVGTGARMGARLAAHQLQRAVPISVDGDDVGFVLFAAHGGAPRPPASPEANFLVKLNRALVWGSLGAALIAVLLGAVLARTITSPVRRLTAATQAIAKGELGYQVDVASSDELGELAAAFNKMSADLEEAERSRRQMTADIAHDLRTPTTVILGYTEGLVDGAFESSPEVLGRLNEEARHLERLIEELRTLTLADAGELRLNRISCDPIRLLDRAATAHRPLADAAGVTLRLEAQENLPRVSVDEERFAQVFGNLVGNALRHTPRGGEIGLGAERRHPNVALVVWDTGDGIAVEDLPHVFERHWRGDRARSRAPGASGLGLAIAKSIVEAHGGTITAANRPGGGAEFTVHLPSAG